MMSAGEHLRKMGTIVSLVAAVGLAPQPLQAQQRERRERLLRPPRVTNAQDGARRGERVLRSRKVDVNVAALPGDAPGAVARDRARTITLDLFDDTSIDIVIEESTSNETGGRSFTGRVDGAAESRVSLVEGRGVLVGDISTGDSVFHIRFDGINHEVREVDPNAFPPEADPVPVFGPITAADLPASTAADDGTTFDLMVVYTPGARTAAGGTASMINQIQMGVDDTNNAFARSGILPRVRLVHTAEVGYAQAADMSDDLVRLTRTSDGFMDDVHSLRDAYGADLVKLIVPSATMYCGIAYVMCADQPSFAASAFSVTALQCVGAPAYTFAHEIGHNISANHASDDPVSCGAFEYSLGYKDFPNDFRTVMAYGPPWPRILNFSNPSVLHAGHATGTALANNVLSINNLRHTISNFRQEVSSPTITSPLPGSTLTGSNADFVWDDGGSTSTDWWIYVGSSPGASDYYDSGSLGPVLTHTVTGLPTDGRALHVRLWYLFAGQWRSIDDVYTAADLAPVPPMMTSPTPLSTLSGNSTTFTWTAATTAVDAWWLYVGSTPGGSDIHDSGSLGQSLSDVVSGVPTDGRTLHARLWYLVLGDWLYLDFQYTADTLAAAADPAITSPSPGSTLTGASTLFTWDAGGAPVTEWWLFVGSSPGAFDILDTGGLGSLLSHTVGGLPTDGRTLHVRLWYLVGGAWLYADYQYTAYDDAPLITAPRPGSTLPGSSATFVWSANAHPVVEWWLYVGSTPGGFDILDSGSLGASLSHTVNGLPTDGRQVWVELWYRIGAAWYSREFQFTAAP